MSERGGGEAETDTVMSACVSSPTVMGAQLLLPLTLTLTLAHHSSGHLFAFLSVTIIA
jgi:hypothetical protein